MIRSALSALAIALSVGMVSLPAHAQTAADVDTTLDSLFGEHAAYATFFEALKTAVAAGDKQAVSAMVDYPFTARIGDKALTIRDAAQFVADYDKVITPKVKDAIAAQTYETLFANWQGVMIGNGELWFSGVGEPPVVRIIAIND